MGKRTKRSSGPPKAKAKRGKQHPDHNPGAGVRVQPPSAEAIARQKELDAASKRTEYVAKPAPKAEAQKKE